MKNKKFRPIELVRVGWGASLLLWPRPVLDHLYDVKVDAKSVAVTRVLGARQLAQAALSGVQPSPDVLAMGIWVDAVHAMSALGLAAVDRSRARAGLIDLTVAGAWAALGYHDLVSGVADTGKHDRLQDRLARRVLAFVPFGRPLLQCAAAH